MMTLVLLVALLAAGAFGLYLYLSEEEAEDPAATPEPAAPSSAPSSEELLADAPHVIYLEGNVLKSLAPGEADGEVVREGVAPTAAGPDDGSNAAWVAFAKANKPQVQIYIGSSEAITTAAGTAPRWNHDGSKLAYLSPVDKKTACDEESCEGATRVVVFDPETRRSRSVLDEGSWQIVGWTGDEVVVGDADSTEEVLFVDAKGDSRSIAVPYEGIESVSPDGRWIIFGPGDGPELLRVDGEEIEAWQLGEDGDSIVAADWSSDSSRAAVTAATEKLPPRAFTIDVGAPSLQPFGEDEVVGEVFWNSDDSGLVLTKVDREVPELVASYCSIDSPSSCVPLLSWQTGTSVFGVTNDP
jgi:Tol biopolymer transport system component